MSQNQASQGAHHQGCRVPPGYFLENLVVRADGSVLITEVNHRELWYVSPSDKHVPVEPVKLQRFDQPTVGIVEVEPDVVLVCSTNLYTTHKSFLHRLDFKDWSPGAPLEQRTLLTVRGGWQRRGRRCVL